MCTLVLLVEEAVVWTIRDKHQGKGYIVLSPGAQSPTPLSSYALLAQQKGSAKDPRTLQKLDNNKNREQERQQEYII
jgi:hypothetical protein